MGQFSVKISAPPGSVLSANQHPTCAGAQNRKLFARIRSKPCKYDYFKSAKTHAFLQLSAFFTGDYRVCSQIFADRVA